MILDDSRGLKSVRVPPFYILMSWQDTVTPLANRDISAFSKRVERTLVLPQIRVASPPSPKNQPCQGCCWYQHRLTSNAHSWLPNAHKTWQSLFKKTQCFSTRPSPSAVLGARGERKTGSQLLTLQVPGTLLSVLQIKREQSNLILVQWNFLCYYQVVLLYQHLKSLKESLLISFRLKRKLGKLGYLHHFVL